MNFNKTNEPLQDIINAQFEFFKSDVIAKESHDLYQAAQKENKQEFYSALIEFYTTVAAFTASVVMNRFLTTEQEEQVNSEISNRRTKMIDKIIEQIFEEA